MVIYKNSMIKKVCGDKDCSNIFETPYRLRNKVKLCDFCGDLNTRVKRSRLKLKLEASNLSAEKEKSIQNG